MGLYLSALSLDKLYSKTSGQSLSVVSFIGFLAASNVDSLDLDCFSSLISLEGLSLTNGYSVVLAVLLSVFV